MSDLKCNKMNSFLAMLWQVFFIAVVVVGLFCLFGCESDSQSLQAPIVDQYNRDTLNICIDPGESVSKVNIDGNLFFNYQCFIFEYETIGFCSLKSEIDPSNVDPFYQCDTISSEDIIVLAVNFKSYDFIKGVSND